MELKSNAIDLSGKRFNRLLVVEPTRASNGRFAWKCKCDCGNYIITQGAQLKNGHTKSCGCYKNDVARKRLTKHGLSRTKLRRTLSAMRSRCENPKNISYKNYGGRGISVCTEWTEDFSNFYNWAINNGYEKGLQIDRIDNNGNYEPGNCRWATNKQNQMNKRTTLFYEFNGETKTLKELSEQYCVPYKRLYSRVRDFNWDIEKALTTPIRKKEVI